MQLRNHPLVGHRGVSSWPPAWSWVSGTEIKHPRGEVGILIKATASATKPQDRCFLHVKYDNAVYIGCLFVDDEIFCKQLVRALQEYRGRSVEEIGDIDLSHMM